MKKTPIVGLFALMLVILASACKKDFKTTEDGLKYMIAYQSDTGEVAGEGGYLKMHIKMIVPVEIKQDDSSVITKDSVITDSYTDTYGPAEMLVSKPTYKGCINGGFATLRSGDSVIYKVLSDSLYLKTFGRPLPPFLKGGEELTVIVKVLESLTKENFEKKQKAEQEKAAKEQQKRTDEEIKLLEEAAAKMGYGDKLQVNPAGLLFYKIKETNGATAQTGAVGSFFYKGMFMDGTEFDSNYGGEPFNLTIGQGGAIPGWLEVVDKIKLGEKWVIFLPSGLGYGERGSGKIGPNTPLIFEMELTAIKSAEEVKKEQEAIAKKLSGEENKKIANFISRKNIKGLTKDENIDIYYVIDNAGSGNAPKTDDILVVKVRGFDMDETPVRAFTMEEPPIEQPYNRGAFPPAMEVALGKLKKGGKVRVVTPSRYFHGEQGGGMIAPYTPVLLEIDLVDIKKPNK